MQLSAIPQKKHINFCSLLQYNTVKCTVMHAENPYLKGKMENNWQPCSSHNPIQPRTPAYGAKNLWVNLLLICISVIISAWMSWRIWGEDLGNPTWVFLDRKMATPLNHIWNDAFHINQWTMRPAGFNITLFGIVCLYYETNSADCTAI